MGGMLGTPRQREFLNRVLLNDPLAVSFCESIFSISQTLDDIVDQDNLEHSTEDVYAMAWEALVTLPCNPFYSQNFDVLQPLLQAALVDWMDSNALAKGEKQAQQVAYVLRASITAIVVHCARLVGGYDWMREVSEDIRTAMYTDNIEAFMEEQDGLRRGR